MEHHVQFKLRIYPKPISAYVLLVSLRIFGTEWVIDKIDTTQRPTFNILSIFFSEKSIVIVKSTAKSYNKIHIKEQPTVLFLYENQFKAEVVYLIFIKK